MKPHPQVKTLLSVTQGDCKVERAQDKVKTVGMNARSHAYKLMKRYSKHFNINIGYLEIVELPDDVEVWCPVEPDLPRWSLGWNDRSGAKSGSGEVKKTMATKKIVERETVTTATLESITLYEVKTNTDLTEGRGHEITLGWFLDPRVAARAGKGRYVMGSDCPAPKARWREVVKFADGRMFLLGDPVDVRVTSTEDLRASGLAKLTPEEKAALGLK